MNCTDVTVIIPTYNRLWSLPRAVQSCRNSTISVEIIVIDDGSTDKTWEWLEEQKDVVKLQGNNWGKCWAVNNAFATAKGKYIKFLDSDDMLSPNSLDEQFVLAEKEQADVIVSGFKIINSNDEIVLEREWVDCDDFIAQQLGECDSSHYSSYLFRKEFISNIPHRPDYAFRDDRLFVLELALQKPKVVIHRGMALLHRQHDNERLQFNKGLQGVVQNYQHLKIYKKIIGLLKDRNELTERRIAASLKILWPLTHWIAIDNLSEGVNAYNWLKELNPNFKIPENGYLKILYNSFGFKRTEQLLKIRRFFKHGWN